MPRKYKKKLGARQYQNYTEETLHKALQLIKARQMTIREASRVHKIPVRTLYYKIRGSHPGAPGGQKVLTEVEERHLVDVIIACAEFGAPLNIFDIKMTIKTYLNQQGRTIKKFKNGDTPGKDWCYNFLDRHEEKLSKRMCQNIKKARAVKGEEEIEEYFQNLARSLENVPPDNILNFDETNLTDDPGSIKCIYRRGIKYPERVLNTSKSAISIMFAGSASGTLLPPYVVYKGERLYDQWCIGGPKNTKYNRTKSGWFDAACFQDWFQRVAIPWARQLSGRKILIGDNLSSHIQIDIVRQCQHNDIRFVFLPANSSHLTQPLDVGFFRPLKCHWKQILTDYKVRNPRNGTVNKTSFPQLLKQLIEKISTNQENILKNSFRATGIVPLNPEAVLKKLPSRRVQEHVTEDIDKSLLNYLRESRMPNSQAASRRPKKMLRIEPGKSVSYEELYPASSSAGDDTTEETGGVEDEEAEIDDEADGMEDRVDGMQDEADGVEDVADGMEDRADGVDDAQERQSTAEGEIAHTYIAEVGNFVVVKFPTKKTVKHFIGTVLGIHGDEFQVRFLRKCLKNGFAFPQLDDVSFVMQQDIVEVLSKPEIRRGIHKFSFNQSAYNL